MEIIRYVSEPVLEAFLRRDKNIIQLLEESIHFNAIGFTQIKIIIPDKESK